MNTFTLCQRKWGWEYVNGYKESPGPAAELGSRVHKVLERWLREGIPPDNRTVEGRIASSGIDFLPLPGPGLLVEREFKLKIGRFFFRGFKDLEFMTEDDGLWVVDHKTTGDFIWQKTDEDLLHDIQAMLYAKEALDRYGLDEATLMWLYYRTRNKPKAQPTILRVDRDEVESGFEVIESVAAEMDTVRLQVVDAKELPYNPNACAAFGGCPHQHRCNLSSKDKMKAIMAQADKKQSIREKMQARRKKKTKKATNGTSRTGRPSPTMNPPEAPDEDEALSTEPPPPAANTQAPKKKTSKKKRSKKKSSKSKGTGTSTPPTQTEIPETEPAEEASEPVSTSTENKRGRPKGSKSRTGVYLADDKTICAVLYAAALIGGGRPDQFEAADEAFKRLKEKF